MVSWLLFAAPWTVPAGAPERGDAAAPAPVRAVVEVEEDVYTFEPARNGAGPMWASGSTCLVRAAGEIFASGLETLPAVKPLNNCRWVLLGRKTGGWDRVRVDEEGRTREPCPLSAFHDGRVFLSANPTLAEDPESYSGPARPEILEFSATDPGREPRILRPRWRGEPVFTEHSYRSFAADGARGELILLQNIGHGHAEWSFLDRAGSWGAQGQLEFPWGAEYAKPQPIRVCYPNVALVDRAVHFCGVSDIVEPNPAWRAYKKEITGRDWDYDFRRLFYTWTPDIRSGKFAEWVELASREDTCGWISPRDLRVAPDGAAHVLWTERAIDERLREKFFPDARQSHALNYAVLRAGKVTERRTLYRSSEDEPGWICGAARFHETADGRLLVVCYVTGRSADGGSVSENRLFEIGRGGRRGHETALTLERPFTSFYTATVRAGSKPSNTIDLLGTRAGLQNTISYARIRVSSRESTPPDGTAERGARPGGVDPWLGGWRSNNRSWRGVHYMVGNDAVAGALMEELPELAALGVNALVIEVGYGFEFTSHPELRAGGYLSRRRAAELAAACRKSGIRPIPLFNCLGHQSWSKKTSPLLAKHPEFDETPGQYPDNEGIYCRSWCPQHPDVNPIVFALLDDIAEGFSASAMHVGMDEVFLIASEHCPRCRGGDPAALFAKAVNDLHGHLVKERKLEMLLWGDRLLDAKATGYGKWEASEGGTHPAIDKVPKDIIICDWHYGSRKSYPSIPYFLERGFRVWPAGWKSEEATLALARDARRQKTERLLGHLATTWGAVKPERLPEWPPVLAAMRVWAERD